MNEMHRRIHTYRYVHILFGGRIRRLTESGLKSFSIYAREEECGNFSRNRPSALTL